MFSSSRVLLAACAAAAMASLTVGPAAAGPAEPTAGTVVFIHDIEPPSLRRAWADNSLDATSLVVNNIFLGGQIRDPAGNWVTKLFSGPPRLVKRRPLTVAFAFSQKANWSDGKPVTCADWRSTWQIMINPANNPLSRSGYEDVRSVTCRGKAGTIVFKNSYADWQALVNGSVWPAHITAGKDANRLWQDSIPVSSGPWMFESWQKGVQLTLRKNPRYTIQPMKLDRVVFRYILDTNARFEALKAGEGQVMAPAPQLQVAAFRNDSKFVVDTRPSLTYEHLDFQLGTKGHPALKQPYIRQAIITGINRPQLNRALFATIAPRLPTLQSVLLKTFEKGYQKNFAIWPFSQAKVISMLRAKGCTGGPSRPTASNTDIFSCPGVGRLSFRLFTTSGNQLRTLTFEIIQRQLKSVGIELIPQFQPGGLLFGTTLPSRDFDIALFGFFETPSFKISFSKEKLGCGGGVNYMTYCNRKVTALLEKVAVTLDEDERLRLLNEAERIVAREVPTIPMWPRPGIVIRSKSLAGPVFNGNGEGIPWNVSTWGIG
jgi:peptide/nickel transport system substrate-binding protein